MTSGSARRIAAISGVAALVLSTSPARAQSSGLESLIEQYSGTTIKGYIQPLADVLVANLSLAYTTSAAPMSKFSFGLGGGVKYFPWKTLGLRGQIGYKPTLLKDEGAGDYCDPFGFCQGTLHQFELGAGVIVRF